MTPTQNASNLPPATGLEVDGSCDVVAPPRKFSDLEDRRARAPRLHAVAELEVLLIDQTNKSTIKVTTSDISRNGIAFRSTHPFKPNDRLMLMLPLTGRTGRLILCTVRHAQKIKGDPGELYQVGAEFLEALNMPRTIGPCRIPPKWLMPPLPQKR